MATGTVKCISFDIWNTLIRSNPEFRQHRNSLIVQHFNLDVNPDIFSGIANELDRQHTSLTEVTGRHLYASQMLVLLLQQLKVETAALSSISFQQFEVKLEEIFWKYPPAIRFADTREVLEYLKAKGVKAGLLSNTGFVEGKVLSAFWKKHSLQQYFNFECYSDEVGYCKPNALLFEKVYSLAKGPAQIDKNEFLHVEIGRAHV